MRLKKKNGNPASHDRWLVSYADFITLMFAFFVVMFSSAQMDKRKVGKLSVAIQAAFQQMGIFQTANSKTPMVTTDPLPMETVQVVEDGKGLNGEGPWPAPFDKAEGNLPRQKDLLSIQKELAQNLSAEIQRHEIALQAKREGLVISLRELGFFDSGSAQLRPGSEAAIKRIAAVLATQPNDLRIEGHTDNVPIHNEHFASNWELSTARATELIRLFITRYNIPAARLSAGGYAEYHPVATNQTEAGRALNRRVDIVVLPSALAEPPERSASSPTAGAKGQKKGGRN
jgi:chemotaxis protein MotB